MTELQISKIYDINNTKNIIILGNKESDFSKYQLDKNEIEYLKTRISDNGKQIFINQYKRKIFVQIIEEAVIPTKISEELRKAASKMHASIVEHKIEEVILVHADNNGLEQLSFAEGLALTNYQFLKYFKDAREKKHNLNTIDIYNPQIDDNVIKTLQNLVEGVYIARDLVNEPLSFLTAVQLSKEIVKHGKESGYNVNVLDKSKIEELKMGGLLAVNKGSIDPPTFTILEWKPDKHINDNPYVLVGKGIVYDTGGLSLKPTPDSMDYMKCDMSGAAAVVGAFYAIAKSKLPVHLIGLIPATDNRPDGNAYVPGDVIEMHNKSTVEVLNTDAEGRLILADALSYASKYKPKLVIDIATLTGAASAAIGHYGLVGMGNADKETFEKLKLSGESVYERIAEFPFWEEYAELIKSDIADLKNVGGRYGGAITAGKFLEHFTSYPFIHLDIAGPAYIKTADSYRLRGGTGIGVRLFYDFFKNLV